MKTYCLNEYYVRQFITSYISKANALIYLRRKKNNQINKTFLIIEIIFKFVDIELSSNK